MENLIIIISVLSCSIISGIFGMAGGMILIGVFSSMFPLSHAMIIHGFAQFIANLFRAFLSKKGIVFSFIPFFSIGVILGSLCLKFISYSPTKETLFLILGIVPLLFLLLPKSLNLHIENKKMQFSVV